MKRLKKDQKYEVILDGNPQRFFYSHMFLDKNGDEGMGPGWIYIFTKRKATGKGNQPMFGFHECIIGEFTKAPVRR